MNCPNCGGTVPPGTQRCLKCGSYVEQPAQQVPQQPGVPLAPAAPAAPAVPADAKSKLAAGLLGIFLGALGVHRFYLGYAGIGVAQLILSLLGFVTCGVTSAIAGLWGLIEGIMILTGGINRDGQGRPLRD
jgi:TM2 domain-containing membrane protein YozV